MELRTVNSEKNGNKEFINHHHVKEVIGISRLFVALKSANF